jgi:hypothetical protein
VLCWTRSFDLLCRGTAPHDFHYRIFGQAEVPADQAVGQSFTVHGEDALGLLVGGPLTNLAAEHHPTSPGSGQSRLDALADEIALELGQAGHDGAHQLARRGAKVEAETRSGEHANLPAMKIVEGLHEVLGAAAPTRQLGDKDGIDLTPLGESHHLLALGAIVPRGGFLEDADDTVAGAPGQRAQVTLLALARLIVGADPAVDGDLSQLDPHDIRAAQVPDLLAFCSSWKCIKYSAF